MNVTSKEIIRRIVRHDNPPRLGWDFIDSRYQDIMHVEGTRLIRPDGGKYQDWGEYKELRDISGFDGELRLDTFGNIYGRFRGQTKGECVHGLLQQGWDELDSFRLPDPDFDYSRRLCAGDICNSKKYILASLPVSVFSTLRDVRKIENALADTLLEPEAVESFLAKLVKLAEQLVSMSAKAGIDGLIMYDDWGTQHSPFISPLSFRKLFKPAYAAIAQACHACGLDFILHSCGLVLPLVDDMLDAGIDAFQFDQPELSGVDVWATRYGRKAAFYCPVDIQKVLPTGDRELIEAKARYMAEQFKACGGSLIAKDYGGLSSLADINVNPEWAEWAMNCIVANSDM